MYLGKSRAGKKKKLELKLPACWPLGHSGRSREGFAHYYYFFFRNSAFSVHPWNYLRRTQHSYLSLQPHPHPPPPPPPPFIPQAEGLDLPLGHQAALKFLLNHGSCMPFLGLTCFNDLVSRQLAWRQVGARRSK